MPTALPAMCPKQLHVFVHDSGKVFTSLTARSLPATIPNQSRSDEEGDMKMLTTQWAYETRPWYPLVPSQPVFDGPIFSCLNHSLYSLDTELLSNNRYRIRSKIGLAWENLEKQLLWCQKRLGHGIDVSWAKMARPPSEFGYSRSQVDAKTAKKVALRSRDAFLGIAAVCTYYIMRHERQNSDWATILTADPHYPIPSEWVAELTRTFVGDLTDAVPRTGLIIDSAQGPRNWEHDVRMFEDYGVPIWVNWPLDLKSPFDERLCRYRPSQEGVDASGARSRWGAENGWGAEYSNGWGAESANGWGAESSNGWGAESANGWGVDPTNGSGAQSANDPWGSTEQQIPHQLEASADQTSKPDLSGFPLPIKGSGQKHGEDWKAFFARRQARNKTKEEQETPSARQARQSRERSAASHSLPGKSSKVWVFEWQSHDDYNGFLVRTHITKAQIEDVWGNYNNTTRVFDSFSNQWDLCLAIDPNSIPDGDDREDDDDIMPPMLLTVAPPPPPPSYSSFLHDIRSYFSSHEVASSANYDRIETFVSVLRYHLGYRLDAPTSTPRHGSTMFDEWIRKTQWVHACKLVGDLGEDLVVSEEQQGVIKSFLGYIVTLPESKLSDIQPDLWDLGPHPSLPVSNSNIRVSCALLSQQRFYIIEPLRSQSLTVWKLAVPEATTAVMCLRRDWGSDIRHIALCLIERGMAFKTLQKMSIAPHFRRPFSELRAYLPVRKPPRFQAIFADYVVYEQRRHEFMNQPRARAALLHGGIVWRLALHSLGVDHLPSVLDGISLEAVPFGLMLCSDDQSYFDDALLEEEVDFICGTYYVDKSDSSVEIVSWWPRPQAWAASGLNVGFWSARCEKWFQTRLEHIRQGVSRFRESAPNDANGPMSGTQWKRSLKFNNGTPKMMNNMGVACYEFLLNKAPVWTDSDV